MSRDDPDEEFRDVMIAGGQNPKVAVLLSGRELFSSYSGGASARWVYEVYRHLQDKFEIKVFGFPTTPEGAYPLPHATSRSVAICSTVSRIPLLRRYEDWIWLRSLFSELRRYDVIHIHNRPQWTFLLREMGYRGALIVHLHNNHLGHWQGALLDTLAPAVDAVVACSSYLRDTFVGKSRAISAKTRVVFNGVEVERFCPNEKIREPKTIFFVGRFDPEKGVLQLVEAYSRVLNQYPDAKLIIGGTTGFGTHQETTYVRGIRELAQRIDHSGAIRFPGYIHHDRELPLWFQRATIFCCPSLFQEPFGLVNAEAMACATPVVASDRGGIPEVLSGTGRLVNPEDPETFASVLSELLSDARQREQLGRAGLERARRLFDWRVIARQWAGLVSEVVQG